VIYVCCSNY